MRVFLLCRIKICGRYVVVIGVGGILIVLHGYVIVLSREIREKIIIAI